MVSPNLGELDEDALTDAMNDDPDEMLGLLAELTAATDPALRARARALANRMFLRLALPGRPVGRGIGRLVRGPYRPDAGDLDLDASIEALVDARATRTAVDVERLRVRTWAAPSTAWCLVLDRSGSMHGRELATAALATAAVVQRAGRERAVLSFARDVVAVASMADDRPDDEVVDRVLALRGHGTTDLAGALRAAADQLGRSAATRRVTVLLSDCRATEPGDVHAAAALVDGLVVLAPAGDDVEARALAAAVGAPVAAYGGPSTIPDALADVLDALH